jgi:hypothetical protein
MSTQVKVAHREENFFESSAWVLFLVIGLLEILFGWGDMIAGVENDPAILISIMGITPAELKAQDPVFYAAMDHQQKVIGQILWITGALISIISLTAFRQGARWAWFTFWLIPVGMGLGMVSSYDSRLPGESLAPPFYSASLFAILTIVWLALSYRKYVSNRDRD